MPEQITGGFDTEAVERLGSAFADALEELDGSIQAQHVNCPSRSTQNSTEDTAGTSHGNQVN
jgi:hypothetical protein